MKAGEQTFSSIGIFIEAHANPQTTALPPFHNNRKYIAGAFRRHIFYDRIINVMIEINAYLDPNLLLENYFPYRHPPTDGEGRPPQPTILLAAAEPLSMPQQYSRSSGAAVGEMDGWMDGWRRNWDCGCGGR